MSILDRVENQEAIKAAKAEILAALAKTDGKLDVGVMAQTVKSVQHGVIDLTEKTEMSVKINPVEIEKAVCLHNGSFSTLVSQSRFTDNNVQLQLGSDSVTAYTVAKYANAEVSFTVVEFY